MTRQLQILTDSERTALAALMRKEDHMLFPGRGEGAATLRIARALARKRFGVLTERGPRDWYLAAAPGPIRLGTAREVRALLVDAGGMPAAKFTYVHAAVLDDGYCPFRLGGGNYCLTITRDRSEWQLNDVYAPIAADD